MYLQSSTKPNGYRFKDPLVVEFAMFTLLLGGIKYYDFLHANANSAMPSFRTVNWRIAELYLYVREGEINLKNLVYYVEKNSIENSFLWLKTRPAWSAKFNT